MDLSLSSVGNHGRLSSMSDVTPFTPSEVTLAARWRPESESRKF